MSAPDRWKVVDFADILPAAPQETGCPDDCPGCYCHSCAPCSHCEQDHDDIDGTRAAEEG